MAVACRRDETVAAITQRVVFVVVVRGDVIVVVVLRGTPAVLRADCAAHGRRMFQLLVRFELVMMIDDRRRGVAAAAVVQMIIVDDAVEVEDLRVVVEARLLVVVERIQVVARPRQRIFP